MTSTPVLSDPPTPAPTAVRSGDEATPADAWAALVRVAVQICDGSAPDLAVALDEAVSVLELELGCTPTGPGPNAVVTARRLARVQAEVAGRREPLADHHLDAVVRRLDQAIVSLAVE